MKPNKPEPRPPWCCCDWKPGGHHRFGCLRQQPVLPATLNPDGTFTVTIPVKK